jgi:signal transduction histidine kinase/ligand-binding sensor domain-containing protein/DNA-binding response OmpR family regulator
MPKRLLPMDILKCIVPGCLWLLTTICAAQEPRLSYLGIEQGLSNNSVTSIYQDHNGFMWFGTFDGLNRYDGHTCKVFRNKLDDSTSLSTNRIVVIEEDKRNNIWIGTKRGVSIINHTAPGFTSAWFVPSGATTRVRVSTPVKDIKSDKNGNVFMATDGVGLLMAGPGSFDATQVPVYSGKERVFQYSVQALAIDQQQRLWVFLNGKGLYLYDYTNKLLKEVNVTINAANCMEVYTGNYLWIGATDGLHQYDITHNAYTMQYREGPGALSSARIIQLRTDKNNALWIATDGGGVNVLDPSSGRFTYLAPGNNGQSTINSSAIYAIYVDRQDRKWIGTLRGGVNIIDPRRSPFKAISHKPGNTNSLVNDFVLSFAEEPSGNLWIGTDGGGLSYWNRKENRYTNYIHQGNDSASLSNNFVTSICHDNDDQVWIATYGGGINRFNKKSQQFKHFSCQNNWGGVVQDVWVLYEDHARNLWAGTVGGGLNRLNRTTQEFEIFDKTLGDVLALAEDKDGILWAGNFNSLIRIDPVQKKYDFYKVNVPVRTICVASPGEVWLGTEGYGLLKFVPGKTGFKSFSTDKGLNNPSVLMLLDDGKGSLWMSTFSGLSKFNKETQVFQNYDESDGLQSNQFNYNAALHLASGEFIFGGIRGFNLFYPDSVHLSASVPPFLLTGIRVNNHTIYRDNAFVTRADADHIYALKLPYNQANVSFDMSALEYSNSEKIKYAYYLEGWDQHWNYVGDQRSGIYSSLREGNYVLKVKTTNTNGDWEKEKIVLEINVLPPWYRSWWAYLLYAMLIGGAIVLYQRYRAYRASLKYEVALARAERETERVINEREKEINEKRLSFFTNISHEFRTPLTLIINPLHDLLSRHREGDDARELNTIGRNARRLLSLIDQLLLFRKTDKGLDSLTLTRFNFSGLCRDVYLYFIQEAKTKNISYELKGEESNLELYGDRNKVEIILYNLISNAFKYTPVNGSIVFEIKETDRYVQAFITDTGTGIPAEAGNRIFERFYKASGHAKSGFGIGLFLVKQFIDQHLGQVSYTSEPGKGTSFEMSLPKGKAHFGTQDIIDEPESSGIAVPDIIEEEEETEEPLMPGMPVISDRKVLLVVDDDVEILSYVVDLFANQFTIYKATNGREGLELTHKYTPDLVISDIMMPEMTGIEMCRMIREDPALSHIPVILLTAMTSEEIQLKSTEQGADDYLTKPFNKDLLIAKVKGLLKNRTHLQNYFYDHITLKNNQLKVPPEYKQLLGRCIEIVENHLDDDQFSIQVLAKEMGMSHSYLYKKIKLISGQSANAFIRFLRLRKAAELLIGSRATVNEVAYKVGFSDIKYFRVQFNKLFGMNPSDYIKKYRDVLGENLQVDKSKGGQ